MCKLLFYYFLLYINILIYGYNYNPLIISEKLYNCSLKESIIDSTINIRKKEITCSYNSFTQNYFELKKISMEYSEIYFLYLAFVHKDFDNIRNNIWSESLYLY